MEPLRKRCTLCFVNYATKQAQHLVFQKPETCLQIYYLEALLGKICPPPLFEMQTRHLLLKTGFILRNGTTKRC